MITIEDIKKIALLARLKLTPAEEALHAKTMGGILDYMQILNELNTDNIISTSQVTGLTNIVREDNVIKSNKREKLIIQIPQLEKDELVVPGVFG